MATSCGNLTLGQLTINAWKALTDSCEETHELLKKYCEEHGFKMGSLVENLIKKHVGVPKPTTGVLNADKVKNQSY